jgi:hypothetical protein
VACSAGDAAGRAVDRARSAPGARLEEGGGAGSRRKKEREERKEREKEKIRERKKKKKIGKGKRKLKRKEIENGNEKGFRSLGEFLGKFGEGRKGILWGFPVLSVCVILGRR